jgi:hypothetical protein
MSLIGRDGFPIRGRTRIANEFAQAPNAAANLISTRLSIATDQDTTIDSEWCYMADPLKSLPPPHLIVLPDNGIDWPTAILSHGDVIAIRSDLDEVELKKSAKKMEKVFHWRAAALRGAETPFQEFENGWRFVLLPRN